MRRLVSRLLRSFGDKRPDTHRFGVLHVTPTCNQSCVFCRRDTRKTTPALPYDQVVARIEQDRREGIDSLMLFGGEPQTRADFDDIVRYGTARGMRMGLSTNGVLLGGKGTVDRLVGLGVRSFEVSLHAADAVSYQRIHGVSEETWQRKLEGLRQLNRVLASRSDCSLHLETVVFNGNKGAIDDILSVADRTLPDLKPTWAFKNLLGYPCMASRPTSSSPGRLSIAEGRELFPALVVRWRRRFDIGFDRFPLCALPGLEHRSRDLGALCRSGRPDEVFASPLHSRHRQLCRSCSLWMICSGDVFREGQGFEDPDDVPVPLSLLPLGVVERFGLPTPEATEALERLAQRRGTGPENVLHDILHGSLSGFEVVESLVDPVRHGRATLVLGRGDTRLRILLAPREEVAGAYLFAGPFALMHPVGEPFDTVEKCRVVHLLAKKLERLSER